MSLDMKIAITGHTAGLGRAFYQHFSVNHEVIGLSRSNGYDIVDVDKIADAVANCDLFFNNAHCQDAQSELIKRLHNTVSMVTSGSMAADTLKLNDQYFLNKRIIENTHKLYVKRGGCPMLLLKMGFLESHTYRLTTISYKQVISAVEFWLTNPAVTMIEFDNISPN